MHRTPPAPSPSEDRLFTEWSSLDSPHARTSPQNASLREIEQNINQHDNQTTQPGSEPAQVEAMGNALCDNMSSPSTHQHLDEVGVRMMDTGTNTIDVEVRSQRDGVRVINSDVYTQASCLLANVLLPTGRSEQMPMSRINQSISGYDPELLRGSHATTQDTGIQESIPQLDRPVSVPSRTRSRLSENMRHKQGYFQEGIYHQGTSASCRREYPGESSEDTHSDRRSYGDQRPHERGSYQSQNGRPPDRRRYQDRGYSRRGYPN